MTALGLTPEANPLAPARRTRRTFEETVQLLELFLHREGRVPAARETVRVDGDTVKLGVWLSKAATGTAPASSPSITSAWSPPCSRGIGRPRTPCRPFWCRPCPGW
ncbi:hypothetical protein [Streptomyces echinatus]|uniref:hypothetical protein n=1 Tax=Streptomyces echinatus TaxID=67293 RepID=UPI0037BCA156